MSLSLYQDQLQQDANTRPGTATVEPGFTDNFFRGTGMLAVREGLVKAGRAASMAGSILPIIGDKITGGTVLQSKYFQAHDTVFKAAVDWWTPKPGEVGLAAEIAGPLLGILPQVLLSPAGAVATQTLGPAEDLINEPGVTPRQAVGVGVAQGAGFALGIWAPAALGYNLPSRVAAGAGMNWFQGVVTRGASTAILSGTEAAKNYPAFGGKEQIIDILLGAAFGGAAHVVPGWRAESERVTDQLNVKGRREIKEELGVVTPFDLGAAAARATNNMRAAGEAERAQRLQDWADSLKPSDKAALAVHRLGQHLNIDSAPGKPTGPLATEIHVERMRSTIDAILRGDPLPPEPVPRETMDQFTTRVGKELGEPLGLAPEVALLQRAYIEQGPEAGRAMLDELANQVPDRPDGFVEQAHQQLTERAEQFKNAETPFAPDPQREADAMEITRGMQEAAPRIAREEGLPEGPTILLPIEEQLKAHLMETGYRQADGTWRKLTQDEANQYIKDHAALYAPTWKAMADLTEGKMSPEQLAHRYLADVKMRAPAPAGALQQRLTPAQHIADYKPTVESSQYGGTRYRNQYLDLGNSTAYGKGEKGERRAFRIMDKSAGTAADVGFVILEIDRNGKFAALRNIEIRKDIQGKGIGENVVATLVAHNGRGYTMDVVDITHGGHVGTDGDALPFWQSMGTQLKNYSSDSRVQMDGMLSLEDYLGARSGQRTAAGDRGTAGGNLPADGSPAGAARGSLPGSGPTAADRAELARLNSLFQGPARTLATTRPFLDWFGDSKAVDADGNPLMLYHGTADSFDTFQHDHPNAKDLGWLGRGFYFTNQPDMAGSYTNLKPGNTPNIMPVFLRLENPYRATLQDKQALMLATGRGETDAPAKWTADLQAKGHDGVILDYGMTDGTKEYVVFTPNQVKSGTGNNGNYSRKKDKTYNFVIYDEKAMDIVHMEQDQARGYLHIGDDRQMTIGFLQSTDPSTPIHEPAHFFLEMLDDLAKEHPKAEAEMQVLFKEWGVDRATWDTWSLNDKRFFHEQFARSWEAYIMTNKAPTPELRSVFRRFRDWLVSIYETAQTLNVKVSTEMRALFDRLHGSQQLDPSTDPAAAAAASGAPPPPQPGVESQPPGTVDPFADMAVEPKPYVAKTIEDPGMREFLRAMVEQEVGWAQIGGRNLGMANGVPNFSTWIPKAEWWQARPANVKKLKESEYFDAVNKALLGEPLKPLEQRAVDFMMQVANRRMEAEGAMGKEDWLEASKAVHEAGLEPTTANVVDADAVAIANQINEGMVERLAMQYDADDAGFMAEIRRIIDDHQNPETAAGGQETVGQPQEAVPAARPAAEPSPKAGAETAGSARVDLLAQEADRFVAERPDLMLEFDMPDGTTQKMTAAQYLADVRESAAMARDDVKLIYEAAQCLLGAT